MSSPLKITNLFAKLKQKQKEKPAQKLSDDEPDWLADVSDEGLPDRSRSTSREVSPPPLTTKATADAQPSTSKAAASKAPKTVKADAKKPKAAPKSEEGPDADQDTKKATSTKGAPLTRVHLRNPEKINYQRVLVELPGGAAGECVDLSGDAGAVGRFSTQDDDSLLLDLKGVVFNAALVPMPCTACVVNISTTEGKVESYFNEFLQLTESNLFSNTEVLEGGNLDAWFLAAEDEDGMIAKKQPASKKASKGTDLGVASGKVVKVAGKGGKSKSSSKAKGGKSSRGRGGGKAGKGAGGGRKKA